MVAAITISQVNNGTQVPKTQISEDLQNVNKMLSNLEGKKLSPQDENFVTLINQYSKARANGGSIEDIVAAMGQSKLSLEDQKQTYLQQAAGNPAAIAKVEEWADINSGSIDKLLKLLSNPETADKLVAEELAKMNEKPSYVAPEPPSLPDNSMGNKSLVAA